MKVFSLLLASSGFLFFSCTKNPENTTITKQSVKGVVQKGPYLNGTMVTINELNSDFSQTGKTYSTQIEGNDGAFTVSNLNLSSKYVLLLANGYYFNEVSGNNSNAQLQLSALSDLTDSSTVNVNILSTLERKRVEYLVSQGVSFKDAKVKAESEILKIFNIDKTITTLPEYLNIVKKGDDNAILLAISSILQGYRSEAELSELIANISDDIKTDGQLDDAKIGTSLINHAKTLNSKNIRTNLLNKFANQGVEISDFETHIKSFIANTKFVASGLIQYPDSGKVGYNLLMNGKTDYSAYVYKDNGEKVTVTPFFLSFTALVPKLTQLKVVIKFKTSGTWLIDPSDSGWKFTYQEPNSFVVTSDNSKELLDAKFDLLNTGSAIIEIYENGVETPTRVKNITW